MEKKTLSNILEGNIFTIPDYQRGYAWEEQQWKDFVLDIDALTDPKIRSHYTGTIVTYHSKDEPKGSFGVDELPKLDVVDGQQRLTTCSLYLSIIIHKLLKMGKTEYESKLPLVFSGAKSRLVLNNDTQDFFYDLVSKGAANVDASGVHQKRLADAFYYLTNHIKKQLKEKSEEDNVSYLIELYKAITSKLNFTSYQIEEESEIGMTFELMNSRGKDLSALELLKNYLMYWVYRNVDKDKDYERKEFTDIINKSWKEVYINVAKCGGSETQCLRIAWTIYHSYTPIHWKGYKGFKANDVIPIRDWSEKSKENTQQFIKDFANGLAEISTQYAAILKPEEDSRIPEEYIWLQKIKNLGNVANFLPLIEVARKKTIQEEITVQAYVKLLQAIEKYAFRVFLWQGKRSNSGLSKFYKWAYELYRNTHSVENITEWILGIINMYSNENSFRNELKQAQKHWYHWRRLLRYTLFEYELHLLKGKNKPKLAFSDLSDATIEHILPQNPDERSFWLEQWTQEQIDTYLHDVSNLVLTKDNSSYKNFDFDRKKGTAGAGRCYANSDIRQERKIADYEEWTAASCRKRKDELTNWIIDRWGIDKHYVLPKEMEDIEEEEEIEMIIE